MKDLVKFHSNHKYLFLAYNEQAMRACGSIAANHEHNPVEQVFADYQEKMQKIMEEPARFTAIINTLHHIFGGISDNLASDEKQFFLNSVEEYRDERIPLSTLSHMLKSYAIRFNNDYLKQQVFLEPYPKALVNISDSVKGRDY